MKKTIGVALAVLLGLALLSAPGAVAAPKKKKQVVEGSILFPALFAQGAFDGCWGGLTRRLTQTTQNAAGNGVFGYRFDVDKATWNKKFVLKPTGGEGTVDLDLFLYLHFPALEETADDPVNGGTPASIDFNTRKEGGEAGVVPKGATHGIVCMYGGPSHYGYNATFNYTAG